MEAICNLPISMLALCGADGQLQPLRFRLEDEDHQLQTVHIQEIISVKHVEYVGIESMIFLCRAAIGQRERMFELRYTIRTHRWVLLRMVY